MNAPDFTVADHGSIFILTPKSDAGRQWAADHLPEDAQQWAGGTVVEHRYIADIVEGIWADGLAVDA